MSHVPTSTLLSPLRALVEWFRQHRDADEFAGLDAGEAHRIAADLNVSVDDLIHIARQSDDEIALMGRMMTLFGIDKARMEAEMPAVIRQMALTCAHCQNKGKCSHDFDNDPSIAKAINYCANADMMLSMSER